MAASTKDGGWAWVILAAVFTNMLLAGIVFVNGIFNLVFLEEFAESTSLTSWCGAIQASLLHFGGNTFVSNLQHVLVRQQLSTTLGNYFPSNCTCT